MVEVASVEVAATMARDPTIATTALHGHRAAEEVVATVETPTTAEIDVLGNFDTRMEAEKTIRVHLGRMR